jgi:carbamoyl-phosphate synthase large subunit
MKQKIVIGITGLNNTDNPGPGIPVIRGLRESKDFDVRIIGLAYENLEPGIYMHELVDKSYLVPYPSAGSQAFLDRIFYIHNIENFDLIIPNFDAELYTFITNQDKLKEKGIKTFLPSLEQFEERHKANLQDFGKKYDINVPKSKAITEEKDLAFLPEGFAYPLWIKGKFYEAYAAKNYHEAASFFYKISAKWGLPIIIQEYIKGTEVNVIALGDGQGNMISCVPMRKQYITDKGKAWGGIAIKDENLISIAQAIISKTKWRGGMELEMIKTKDGKYFLIEINPRIPAWVYLAVGAGQNIPEALVKLAFGEKLTPMTDYKVGTMFIRYSMDMIGNISDFEKININGEL